jgi:hypothetical protein
MYESYQYNRTLSDANSTSLNDYPSKIVLNSSNFDFAHCKHGGADIRFYDETISAAIPYWIEKWENNEAVVWIKIADTNNIIKMYYGDESANSESNFSAVFQHGSDFESDFGDLTPIVASGGSVTIANSSATLGDDAFWQCLVGKEVLSNPAGVYLRDLYPVRDMNDRYLPDANGHIVAHVNSRRTSDNFATIMRTTSPDGINWSEMEPVLNDGATSKRDANVIKISEGIFKLWCRVGTTGDLIRYTSVDGLSWTDPETVLSTSAFSDIAAGAGIQVPWITPLTDDRLALVFEGHSGDFVFKIWGAISNDMGETWLPLNDGDPIFTGSSAWDVQVANPKLIQIAESTYILEYNGRASSNTPWSIGVATSTDLINWVPNPINPILYGTKATYGLEVAGYAKSQNGFLHWHQPTSGNDKTSRIWYSKPIVKKGCILRTRTQSDAAGMCIDLTGLNNYSVETKSILGADGAFENTASRETIFELIDRSSVLSSGVEFESLTRRLAVRRVGFDLSTDSGKIMILKYGAQTQYWSGSAWTTTRTYLDYDADAYVNVKFDCDDTNYVLTVSGFDPITIPKNELTFTNGMILLLGDVYTSGYGPLRSFYTYVRVRPYAVTEPSFALGEEIGSGPTITAHPQNSTKIVGQTAQFTVAATGTGTLHYQWKKDGTNIGTDSDTLSFVTVIGDNGAQITCVVTDDNGSTTSNAATLTVQARVLTSIVVTGPRRVAFNKTKQFTANGFDQLGDPISTGTVIWTATGGTIDETGLFTAGETAGEFAVTATAGEIEGGITISIHPIGGYLIPNTNFIIRWSEIISDTVDLSYSIDAGSNWIPITSAAPNQHNPEFGTGYYEWLVPEDLPLGTVLIHVADHDYPTQGFDQEVYVTSEIKYIGANWRLSWAEFISDTLQIDYQINGEGDWNLITSAAPNHNGSEHGSGYYDWIIDAIECDYLVIRVTDVVNDKEVFSPAVTIIESEITPITCSGIIGITLSSIIVGNNVITIPEFDCSGNINLTISSLLSSSASLGGITLEDLNNKLDVIISLVNGINNITSQMTFSGDLLNVRVADKGILNDISVGDILNGTVDTKTVNEILEILLAYVNGRITVNGNTLTYYKQNNSTSLFTLTGSDSERTRI